MYVYECTNVLAELALTFDTYNADDPYLNTQV